MPRPTNPKPLAGRKLGTAVCLLLIGAFVIMLAASVTGRWLTGGDVVPPWTHFSMGLLAAVAVQRLLGQWTVCDLLDRLLRIWRGP